MELSWTGTWACWVEGEFLYLYLPKPDGNTHGVTQPSLCPAGCASQKPNALVSKVFLSPMDSKIANDLTKQLLLLISLLF